MREPQPPQDVDDIGPKGEHIGPFLFRLRSEHEKAFAAIKRTLRMLIPSVEDLRVELDKKRGVVDIEVRQDGIDFSSRVISEGTLRVLALACIAANPWGGRLLAFEEPENGVHPRRIELIAELLFSLSSQETPPKQIVVTSHSPIFCNAVMRSARKQTDNVILYNVIRQDRSTRLNKFEPTGPLFNDQELARALTASGEDGLFEAMMLRGFFDE
jgi:predicted ATPase